MAKIEKKFQNEVEKYLNALHNCWYAKNIPTFPDIFGTYHGVFFALELKKPDGKRKLHQVMTIRTLNKLGAKAAFAETMGEVEEFMEEVWSCKKIGI